MSDHHRAVPEPSEDDLDSADRAAAKEWEADACDPPEDIPSYEDAFLAGCERYRSRHADLSARVAALTAELAAGRERVRELEAGLRPFADYWNRHTDGTGFSWHHFEHAARLLRPGAGGEGTKTPPNC